MLNDEKKKKRFTYLSRRLRAPILRYPNFEYRVREDKESGICTVTSTRTNAPSTQLNIVGYRVGEDWRQGERCLRP